VEWIAYGVVALCGYLLGSAPTGYLVGRVRGVDILKEGSGNMGATNTFRVLGKKAGATVLIVDLLKGLCACVAIPLIGAALPGEARPEVFKVVAGITAILGHNYTCWLGFRGGKGIATSAGVLIALTPIALLILLAVWGLSFWISKYVSLASILAAVALPIATVSLDRSPLLVGVTTFMAAMAIYKHRTNIRRLLDGTEHRFGKPKSNGDATQ
jgi:glycerol-3-phosphate acyltransferase PlsY